MRSGEFPRKAAKNGRGGETLPFSAPRCTREELTNIFLSPIIEKKEEQSLLSEVRIWKEVSSHP